MRTGTRHPRNRGTAGSAFHWMAGLFAAILIAGCASLPKGYPREPSVAWDRPRETLLGRALAPDIQAHPNQSGFALLENGAESFAARRALADAAERTLDLQYYLFHDDFTGRLILDRLIQAADRGVRVRILVDDLQNSGRDAALTAYTAHPNIQVRVFNPFAERTFLWRQVNWIKDFRRLNQRMHNKMFVADNHVAIVGGRNIGDEYFSARQDVNFADLDLLAVGPVVADLSGSFDEYWNSKWAVPIEAFARRPPSPESLLAVRGMLEDHWKKTLHSRYVERAREARFAERLFTHQTPFVWAPSLVVYDQPKIAGGGDDLAGCIRLGPQVFPLAEAVQSEVIIASPYLIPGKDGIRFLERLREREVSVRILTNSFASTNIPLVHGGYSRYRKDMLKLGVELYETRPTLTDAPEEDRELFGSTGLTLHTKAFIVDQRYVFVGSLNLDPRSFYLNTELAVVIDSPELAEELARKFSAFIAPPNSYRVELGPKGHGMVWITEEGGKEVRYTKDPRVGFWRGLKTKCISIFAPESML